LNVTKKAEKGEEKKKDKSRRRGFKPTTSGKKSPDDSSPPPRLYVNRSQECVYRAILITKFKIRTLKYCTTFRHNKRFIFKKIEKHSEAKTL
jgi:hypothetical protein